jgi:hypothetical protein
MVRIGFERAVSTRDLVCDWGGSLPLPSDGRLKINDWEVNPDEAP